MTAKVYHYGTSLPADVSDAVRGIIQRNFLKWGVGVRSRVTSPDRTRAGMIWTIDAERRPVTKIQWDDGSEEWTSDWRLE